MHASFGSLSAGPYNRGWAALSGGPTVSNFSGARNVCNSANKAVEDTLHLEREKSAPDDKASNIINTTSYSANKSQQSASVTWVTRQDCNAWHGLWQQAKVLTHAVMHARRLPQLSGNSGCHQQVTRGFLWGEAPTACSPRRSCIGVEASRRPSGFLWLGGVQPRGRCTGACCSRWRESGRSGLNARRRQVNLKATRVPQRVQQKPLLRNHTGMQGPSATSTIVQVAHCQGPCDGAMHWRSGKRMQTCRPGARLPTPQANGWVRTRMNATTRECIESRYKAGDLRGHAAASRGAPASQELAAGAQANCS